MIGEHEIDRLIEAGWLVIESDFDETAFLNWRLKAYQCLEVMLGPNNKYTRHFRLCVKEPSRESLLEGAIVLGAIKMKRASEEAREGRLMTGA